MRKLLNTDDCRQAYAIVSNAANAAQKIYCEFVGKCSTVSGAVQRISMAACPNTTAIPVSQLTGLTNKTAQTIASYTPLKLICGLPDLPPHALLDPSTSCLKEGLIQEIRADNLNQFVAISAAVSVIGIPLSAIVFAGFFSLFTNRDEAQTVWSSIKRTVVLGAAVGSSLSFLQVAMGAGVMGHVSPVLGISMGDSLEQASLGGAIVGGISGFLSSQAEDQVLATIFWSHLASTICGGVVGSAVQYLWKSDNQSVTTTFMVQTMGSAMMAAGVALPLLGYMLCFLKIFKDMPRIPRPVAMSMTAM